MLVDMCNRYAVSQIGLRWRQLSIAALHISHVTNVLNMQVNFFVLRIILTTQALHKRTKSVAISEVDFNLWFLVSISPWIFTKQNEI